MRARQGSSISMTKVRLAKLARHPGPTALEVHMDRAQPLRVPFRASMP